MGLNFTLPTEKVVFPGGDLTVRGLSLEDVTTLVRHHGAALSGLFATITAAKSGEVDLDNMTAMASALATAAPRAAAEAIAIAADEPDKVDLAGQLNLTVQIEALEKIGALTFTSEGGIKKVLETVIRVAQGTAGAVKSLRAA